LIIQPQKVYLSTINGKDLWFRWIVGMCVLYIIEMYLQIYIYDFKILTSIWKLWTHVSGLTRTVCRILGFRIHNRGIQFTGMQLEYPTDKIGQIPGLPSFLKSEKSKIKKKLIWEISKKTNRKKNEKFLKNLK